jgi:pyruvate dehydrogenase E2 component (dihydrolipoamide acetyltransferase)
MSTFYLPDLGEGLPNAEIHEWFVNEGDTVQADAPLVSKETAKALVDVPCPHDGIIAKLFGKPGDLIKTGAPLVEFISQTQVEKGTVVGDLLEDDALPDDVFTYTKSTRVKATPMLRHVAKKHHLDLCTITPSGEHQLLTHEDLMQALKQQEQTRLDFEPLQGVKRTMAHNMTRLHNEVVPVTVFDEADVSSWIAHDDITVRLIRAMSVACTKEPSLNAWFDGPTCSRKCFNTIHLGLAIDSHEGLFVPVIHDVVQYDDNALRERINTLKSQAATRSIPSDLFEQTTITLSNFGKFAGKFGTPLIVPPTVAIAGIGRCFESIRVKNGVIEPCHRLPISLSFDHRAITGGEATRFMRAMIMALEDDTSSR